MMLRSARAHCSDRHIRHPYIAFQLVIVELASCCGNRRDGTGRRLNADCIR